MPTPRSPRTPTVPGLSSCLGVLMPDIEVQITTLVRIALHKLREARQDGNPILIHAAQRRFDALVDKLPRSSTAQENTP